MKKYICLISLNLLVLSCLTCQVNESEFKKADEKIIRKKPEFKTILNCDKFRNAGIDNGKLVLVGLDSQGYKKLFVYDEKLNNIYPDTLEIDHRKNKVIRIIKNDDITLFSGYYNLPSEYSNLAISELPVNLFEFQDFWILDENKYYLIDRIPYYYQDKHIECNISNDGRYIICSPYSSVSAGYTPDEDNKLFLYDLETIKQDKIQQTTITCERCIKAFIVEDFIIFGKELPIGQGFDGYYYNIYKAPLKNINDTTLIAHKIELLAISPDGKYIMGRKKLYGNPDTKVIIEVSTRHYQYILGREYPIDYCFYSPTEKKFAFDLGHYVVYIKYPDKFPFNALQDNYVKTTKEQNRAFWQKYTYSTY